MASNVKAQSVLEKISVHHLECSICTNRFRQPKLLDCLHTFCLQCLHELRQSQDPSSTKLACPLCRKDTILKGSGVADLQNNFAFSALVEEVTTQEQLLEGQGSLIKCQACDEENQAVSRCMDCEHFLCQECQNAHQRMTKMKSHQIYTLAQLQSGEIVYRSKLREEVPKCGKHPDQNLNVYCNSCEQVICTTCSVLDHEKPKHSLIGLPEAFEKSKRKIDELVSKVNERKTELKTAIEKTCKTRKKLDTMFASTKKKISEKADQEIARFSMRIRQEEHKLLKESGRIYQERVKALEATEDTDRKELRTKEHKLEEVTQLMQEASCSVVLELEKKLLHNLSQLTEKQAEEVPDELGFMDLDEGEQSLGRLILEEEPKAAAKQSARHGKWELNANIRFNPEQRYGYARHVAAPSDKILWLHISNFGTGAALFTATIPKSPQEQTILQRLHINDLTDDVRCIAVSSEDGKLLALDGRVVKVFNQQHQSLYQFTPGTESDEPTCLAVDDANDWIAVGYADKEQMSLHNLNGSVIGTLPAPGIGLYLKMYNGCLIYTNWDKNRLECVHFDVSIFSDNKVRVLFSVDMTSHVQGFFSPRGLCFESDSIYVAVSRGLKGGDILHYSRDGKYIGHVIQGYGDRLDITFTSQGELVVGTYRSVQIYHRV